MKYAQTGTVEFRDEDDDCIVVKAEPTGSQYDERQNLLGSMKFPGSTIGDNTNMEDLFSGGEMIEVSVDKKHLAEFQFKALFVSMTVGNRVYGRWSDAVGQYRQLSRESKDWIDKQVDSVWKAHEDDVSDIESAEGECDRLPENSSEATRPLEGELVSIPTSSVPSETM